jgi:hypothetical protein
MKTLIDEHIKDSSRDEHFIPRVIIMAAAAAAFAYGLASLILNVDVRTLGFNESGQVDYQVCLKPNNYFVDQCQPAGTQYVASLIDHIKADFEYKFQIDQSVDYSYSYDITSRLVATESGDSGKVLYESQEVILPEQRLERQAGQNFAVKETLELDYGKYNNLITAFRSDYGLTINSYLVVSLNVHIRGQAAEFSQELAVDDSVGLTVPLSERTINVNMQSNDLASGGELEEKTANPIKNLGYIVLSLASLGVFAAAAVTSVLLWRRREAGRSAYEKALQRIMKEYNQLIVETERVPQVPRDKVVEVKDFDGLLDARDTIQQPILHLAVGEDRSLFIIEDQGVAYVYTLSGRKPKSAK